jgi:hypothetical protein
MNCSTKSTFFFPGVQNSESQEGDCVSTIRLEDGQEIEAMIRWSIGQFGESSSCLSWNYGFMVFHLHCFPRVAWVEITLEVSPDLLGTKPPEVSFREDEQEMSSRPPGSPRLSPKENGAQGQQQPTILILIWSYTYGYRYKYIYIYRCIYIYVYTIYMCVCTFHMCKCTHDTHILNDIRWQYCPEMGNHMNNYQCCDELHTKNICAADGESCV